MKQVKFAGLTYVPARQQTVPLTDKYNRVAKLAQKANDILKKMDEIFDKNVDSAWGQSAIAIKIALLTGIRIGNDESANGYMTKPHPNEKNRTSEFVQTFGLTTLKKNHVSVKGDTVHLKFVGKKGVNQTLVCEDKKLAKQVKQLLRFDFGQGRFIDVQDHLVRGFVKQFIGKKFLPKDFRTLHANCVFSDLFLSTLNRQPLKTQKELKAEQKELIMLVSNKLGNTPTVSKNSYIDPELLTLHASMRLS